MTTKQFIANTIGSISNRDRHCSSVFTDFEGTVYSYGYHYPLARIIGEYGFVNTRGYSNTTAKHINWAFSALRDRGVTPIGVPLTNGNALTIAGIKDSARRELDSLHRELLTKKRKNTWVYANLQRQAEDMREALRALATLEV